MKKSFLTFGLTAAIALGVASCSDPVSKSDKNSDDKADKLSSEFTEYLGTQLGDRDRIDLDNDQLGMLRVSLDEYHSDNMNRDEFLRGIREGMTRDTTDYAYLYGLREGLMIREELERMAYIYDIDIDVNAFLKAYSKSFKDTLTAEQYTQMDAKMQMLQSDMMQRQQQVAERRRTEQIKANQAKADKYTKELLEKGYKKSKSGIVYKIENPGKGDKPALNDQVLLNYTGKHINGKTFDSSDGRPVQMSPAGVLEGYREAIMMLGKGGKISVAIPGSMAYGDTGMPRGGIGPNEMLVFDIEIVDIQPMDDDIADEYAKAQAMYQQRMAAQAAVAQ